MAKNKGFQFKDFIPNIGTLIVIAVLLFASSILYGLLSAIFSLFTWIPLIGGFFSSLLSSVFLIIALATGVIAAYVEYKWGFKNEKTRINTTIGAFAISFILAFIFSVFQIVHFG